jgi:hypothetical protein
MTDISVFRDKEHPEDWRVEHTDYNDDGGCTVTVFAAPDAEKRAREYAEWLESKPPRPSAVQAMPGCRESPRLSFVSVLRHA